jgi:hypothetical protein
MEMSNSGTIFVESDYPSRPEIGNQATLGFTVTIDGRRAGTVLPQSSWGFHVSPGSHEVRVGLMWYKSPRLSVVVPAGGQVVLRANTNGKLNSPGLFIRGLFAPLTALRLKQVS